MANLSSLVPFTTAATALSNLVLVSPQSTVGYQPQNPTPSNGQTTQQPPAFLFDFEGEQAVDLESDITDHYVEDNTAIQDQIALRPEIISTQGFIGELNDIAPKPLQLIQAAADKLTTVGAYVPSLSVTAQLAFLNAFQLYQIAVNAKNAAVSAYSSIANGGVVDSGGQNVIGSSGLISQNKQQIAFQQFYGYWRSRTLFTVQTPWAVFVNMAIKNIRAIQDEKTRMISTFEVSFKMIRTTQTVTVPVQRQGRASSQGAGQTDLGTSTPVKSIDLGTGLASSYPGVLR